MTEDDVVEQFGQDTPTADPAKVINVTNVNPHLPTLDPNKVQIAFWQLLVLIGLATTGVGLLFGLLVIR